MKRSVLLVMFIVSGCIAFAGGATTVGLVVGYESQVYNDGDVRANLNASALGWSLGMAHYWQSGLGAFYDAHFYMLWPLSLSYSNRAATSLSYTSVFGIEMIAGLGYMFDLSKRVSLSLGGGLHLSILHAFPDYPDSEWFPITWTWPLGVGFVAMLHYNALFVGVDFAYDFTGINHRPSYIPAEDPVYAGSGFFVAINAGLSVRR